MDGACADLDWESQAFALHKRRFEGAERVHDTFSEHVLLPDSSMTPQIANPEFPHASTESLPGLILDLRKSEVFAGLDDEQILLVSSCCRRRLYYRGETVFEDADPGDDMFLIQRGRVTVRLESIQPHYELVISSLSEGQVLGEMSLLMQRHRSATAVCAEPTEVIQIHGASLREIFNLHPRLGYTVVTNLSRILCRRLERMNRRLLNIMRVNYL